MELVGETMNYRLVMLTHGTHGPKDTLYSAMNSLARHLHPAPTSYQIHQDGVGAPKIHPWLGSLSATFMGSETSVGFCGATARSWERAAKAQEEWILWWEHDFELVRDLDLRDLAAILDRSPYPLAQMALMRDAYSREEKDAGGLFQLRRSDFKQQVWSGEGPECFEWQIMPWFTTNPSLMRRQFMADHPFPDDGQEHCEGRFGIALAEQGYTFGTWGSGEVWCNHVGVRDGSGHGY